MKHFKTVIVEAGHTEYNLYSTGWAKRGPNGVIGINEGN